MELSFPWNWFLACSRSTMPGQAAAGAAACVHVLAVRTGKAAQS